MGNDFPRSSNEGGSHCPDEATTPRTWRMGPRCSLGQWNAYHRKIYLDEITNGKGNGSMDAVRITYGKMPEAGWLVLTGL